MLRAAKLSPASQQTIGNFSCESPQEATSDRELPMKVAENMKAVNEKVAAEIVGLSVHTLQNHRYLGLPPKYLRLGRNIRYRITDLEEYLNACTVKPRTEQYA